MCFEDALANCSPISIAINIDPSRMVPQTTSSGGSIVERDHKYADDPFAEDPVSKMIQDFMCQIGICHEEACEESDEPDFKPNDDDGEESESDSKKPFEKNGVK